MTMLSLDVDKVDRTGTLVGGSYTADEVLAALNTHRYEVFRYEQHRVESGAWEVIADITEMVVRTGGIVRYDRFQNGAMRTLEIELVDTPYFGSTINDLGDAIRCFRLLRMPDGNYAQWMRGTFYVPSPDVPLDPVGNVTLHCPDALRALVDAKLDDYLTVPATADMGTFWGHAADLDDPIEWAKTLIAYYVPLAGQAIGDDPDEDRVPADAPLSFPFGTPILDVVNELLYYAGHDQLVANVTGSYIADHFVPPSALDQDIAYIAGEAATWPAAATILVRNSWKWSRKNFEAFNKWIGIVSTAAGDLLRTKELFDPANPLSTANRRTVTEVFYSKAPTEAKLQEQVDARFEEGQRVLGRLDGQIAAMPHDHRDKVGVSWFEFPWSPLTDSVYIVKGWEEPLRSGAPMTLHLEQSPLTAFNAS